jgi:hypothetical protein
MRLLTLTLCLWCSGVGSADAAEPLQAAEAALQQALELSLDAEFEAARELFERLLAGANLSQAQRVVVLAERSLVLFALGAEEALAKNLRTLAQLAPQTRLSERAPPALLARWQQVALSAREAQSMASAQEQTTPRIVVKTLPFAPATAEEPSNPRRRRALWIGGAAAMAAAALVTTLVLTLPSDRPATRTAVKPSVEF